MDLNEEQLAIAVGGVSKALFENNQNKKKQKKNLEMVVSL